MKFDGIGNAVKLRNGKYNGYPGTYWAWPVDGYYDLHWTDADRPDGSDVIAEGFSTLAETRKEARELAAWERGGLEYLILRQLGGLR